MDTLVRILRRYLFSSPLTQYPQNCRMRFCWTASVFCLKQTFELGSSNSFPSSLCQHEPSTMMYALQFEMACQALFVCRALSVLQSTKAPTPASATTQVPAAQPTSATPSESVPTQLPAAAADDSASVASQEADEEAFAAASLPSARHGLAGMQQAAAATTHQTHAHPAATSSGPPAPAVPAPAPAPARPAAGAAGAAGAAAATTGPTVLPAAFETVTGPLPFRFPRPAAKGEAHGFVFMCTNGTRRECVERGIFGSPENKRSIAQMGKIVPVFTQVFLYNVDERTFEGVWEATEPAAKHLEPYAWTRKWDGSGISAAQGDKEQLKQTKFCMQARVTRKFSALAYRSQVEGFLTRIGGSLFDQVLDEDQVLRLIAALFWNARNPGVQQAAKNTELLTKQQLGARGGGGRGRGRGRGGGTRGRGRGRGASSAPVGGFKEDYQFS